VRRRLRLDTGRLSVDHRQLGEERIRPLRGTLADHQQHREAPLRRTTKTDTLIFSPETLKSTDLRLETPELHRWRFASVRL